MIFGGNSMQIYPKNVGPERPEVTRPTQPAIPADSDGVRSVTQVAPSADRSDKVSISDAGRALAARASDPTASLDPAQAARIRDRVLSGAYDTLEVVEAVARRLLESGDL
jgi:negative regulator of flagellin synthesis FlgM